MLQHTVSLPLLQHNAIVMTYSCIAPESPHCISELAGCVLMLLQRDATRTPWAALPGLSAGGSPQLARMPQPVLESLPETILGQRRFGWSSGGAAAAAGAVVVTVPLTAEAGAVAGGGVYFAVRGLFNLVRACTPGLSHPSRLFSAALGHRPRG